MNVRKLFEGLIGGWEDSERLRVKKVDLSKDVCIGIGDKREIITIITAKKHIS